MLEFLQLIAHLPKMVFVKLKTLDSEQNDNFLIMLSYYIALLHILLVNMNVSILIDLEVLCIKIALYFV